MVRELDDIVELDLLTPWLGAPLYVEAACLVEDLLARSLHLPGQANGIFLAIGYNILILITLIHHEFLPGVVCPAFSCDGIDPFPRPDPTIL